MFDKLEHIRNGEETTLKYNKKIINILKEYIDVVVDANSDVISKDVLNEIWKMEFELQSKMGKEMYSLMTDTILFTRNSSYDFEKEYKIYNEGRNIAISFMNDVKNAVKKGDFELKSIDENAYI